MRAAIIGVGPRGLSLLERLAAFTLETGASIIDEVVLIDENPYGPGCHNDQPEHLLVNTVASQITVFADDSVEAGNGPILHGPTFYEWLKDHGHSLGIDKPHPNTYYSRHALSQYLIWCYDYVCEYLKRFTIITERHDLVTDIEANYDNRSRIEFSDGDVMLVDFVFVTTGHGVEGADIKRDDIVCHESDTARLILNPYPVDKKLTPIDNDETVAIRGMGLTSFDILSELTVGRGGKFVHENDQLTYQPSGYEPKQIILYSRSGLPLTSRAINQKGVSGRYHAQFLTVQRLDAMYKKFGQLDFHFHILPLLQSDMEFVYYSTMILKREGPTRSKLFANAFIYANNQQRDQLIQENFSAKEMFIWEELVNPIPYYALKNADQFRQWLINYLRRDYNDACQGNQLNPLKSACDVMRDLRDNIRYAIDQGMINEGSHIMMYKDFLPVMNRLAVGPPKERTEQLLTLIDQGMVDIFYGPNPDLYVDPTHINITSTLFERPTTPIQSLIYGCSPMPTYAKPRSPVIEKLCDSDATTPVYHATQHTFGVNVDENLRLVCDSPKCTLNPIWVLGPPVEGARFYTYVISRPGVNSKAIIEAASCIKQMMEAVEHQRDSLHLSKDHAPYYWQSQGADSSPHHKH